MSGFHSALLAAPGLSASITAGGAGTVGYQFGGVGSIAGNDVVRGSNKINAIADIAGPSFQFQVIGTVAADFFSFIFINGVERVASAAVFSGGNTWTWAGNVGLANGVTYPFTIG